MLLVLDLLIYLSPFIEPTPATCLWPDVLPPITLNSGSKRLAGSQAKRNRPLFQQFYEQIVRGQSAAKYHPHYYARKLLGEKHLLGLLYERGLSALAVRSPQQQISTHKRVDRNQKKTHKNILPKIINFGRPSEGP